MRALCLFLLLGCWGILTACQSKKLPYYGEPELVKKTVNGRQVEQPDYPVIPPFQFVNQDGNFITERDVTGRIYVADFFFVTCPTICPVMSHNLKEVHNTFMGEADVLILSHTIDPDHDTPTVLKQYASNLGVKGSSWQFVTGDREKIYEMGEHNYFVTAGKDSTAAGGYMHSGHFILVDKERHVRGMYDGTTKEGTTQLITDIKRLRAEYD